MLETVLMCLAMNVYHEARSSSYEAQIAVASVVMNRVEDARFPDTVCEVVQEGGDARRHECQFSWFCDGMDDWPRDRVAWQEAHRVSVRVLLDLVEDPTDGALYYHAPYVDPVWSGDMTETHRDDAHIFYRPGT